MRVITGTAKGKPLKSLTGRDTRPTGDRIKESIFSVIQFEVENSVVLDLFAGSGQLGIEALSRGAEKAYFVDNNAKAISIIRENLEYTGFDEVSVSKLPYNAFLRMVQDNFDIAFLDPPYEKGIIAKALPLLIPKMSNDSVIVCEHEKRLCLPEQVDGFYIDKVCEYGSMSITIYRNGKTNEDCDLSGEL
jgi:16S rRNA (guanine(966)-N(2))-methyltransferase RsmD